MVSTIQRSLVTSSMTVYRFYAKYNKVPRSIVCTILAINPAYFANTALYYYKISHQFIVPTYRVIVVNWRSEITKISWWVALFFKHIEFLVTKVLCIRIRMIPESNVCIFKVYRSNYVTLRFFYIYFTHY